MGSLLWIGIVFLIISLVAYILGANGVAGMSASLGKTVLGIFLVLAVVLIIAGMLTGTHV